MYKKVVLTIFFLVFSLYPGYIWNQECHPPSGPPPDNADDNYSFNLEGGLTVKTPTYCEQIPFLGIFINGNVEEMENLLNTVGRSYIYVGKNFNPEYLLNYAKVLIIPTGGLFGLENSAYIKLLLDQFVSSGGILIVFAQQKGIEFDLIPRPEGETLKAYGWRQDQSCYNGAVYFDTLHPVVCSSTSGLVTATNDGYFDAWPSTATVLLNRTKNREGALLYYPYGENGGHVILTSLYTDWGYAHSQATSAEIKIIRDLITFAKNPNLPILMYNLEENANPDITLDVVVKNNTDSPAGKVKVIVSDPNREIILYESEETCINYCIA